MSVATTYKCAYATALSAGVAQTGGRKRQLAQIRLCAKTGRALSVFISRSRNAPGAFYHLKQKKKKTGKSETRRLVDQQQLALWCIEIGRKTNSPTKDTATAPPTSTPAGCGYKHGVRGGRGSVRWLNGFFGSIVGSPSDVRQSAKTQTHQTTPRTGLCIPLVGILASDSVPLASRKVVDIHRLVLGV